MKWRSVRVHAGLVVVFMLMFQVVSLANPVWATSPSISTTIKDASGNEVTEVTVGTTVHDTATLSHPSGDGGTVTYKRYSNGQCSEPPDATTQDVTVTGTTVPPSSDFTPTSAGWYSYKARYVRGSTDKTSDCELLTVKPTITTTIEDADGNAVTEVLVGTTVHDTAVLNGVTSALGEVTYKRYSKGDCSGSHIDQDVDVTASGAVPDSSAFTPTSAGSYSYKAHYEWSSYWGGHWHSIEADSTCEPLTVNSPPPDVCGTSSQQPTYGTAYVDGDYGEWSLVTDKFADMHEAWKSDHPILSKLYLRYDCSAHILYVLVLAEDGVTIDVPGDQWVKVASYPYDPNDYDKPALLAFAWVGQNGDVASGWEASYSLDPGWYKIRVHAGVNRGATSGTVDDPCIYLIDCSTRGHIIVDKVTNPSGDPTSFSFTTTGTGYASFSLTDTSPPNNQLLDSGVVYSVQESVPIVWALTGLTCSSSGGSIISTDLLTGKATITLAAGDTVTCTFADRKKNTPSISTELSATSISIGEKVSDSATLTDVTSDAGGSVTYSVYDGEACSGTALDFDTVAVTDGVVLDSELFDVFDSAGKYSFQAAYSGDPNNDGATSDCKTEILTVLENGHIVVDKVTAPTGDTTSFSFITTGSGYNGFSLTDTDIPNDQELKPGVEYSVQESPVPSGWTLAGLDCSSATKTSTISTDLLTGKATITLAAGDIVTCTFTDEKSAGQTAALTVIKRVISDHGGMAEAEDFMIHVMYYDATNAVWLEVTTSPQPGDESGTLYSGLNPGIYKVTEDEPPPLYVQVSITGDCAADGTVTVEANTNKECTITNKDPALVVIKHVIGGSKSASDFIITVNAEYAIPATFPGSESGTRVVLNPGLYSVTEISIAGYSTTYSADCSGTILVDEPTKTCVITNEYSAGQGQTIMVVKNTIGGEGTFAFTVTGPSPSAPWISTSGGTGTTGLIPVAAGTYSISETVPTGWRLTGESCSSGTPESFTVPEGGTVTCTFTNEKLKAPVGGEVYSIDKLALLNPYLTLLGLLGAVGIAFAVRRGRDV